MKKKRNSVIPPKKLKPNNKLSPLKVKHTDFLRRGNGNGGSPTTHDIGKRVNDTGIVTLSPIGR